MDYADLGQRVRKQRQALGWTQQTLAKKIGVSTSFVGHVERGSRKASLETLVSIANAMNLSMDYLLAGNLDSAGFSSAPKGVNNSQRLVMQEILTTVQQHLDNWNKEN